MELIMEYLHNYFYRFKEKGTFTINFNSVTIGGEDLKGKYVKGQYVRIKGSAVNDGIYKVVAVESDELPGITLEGCLSDETFTGYICSLGVPKSFIELSDDVQSYISEHKTEDMVSESFGGYSYTRMNSSASGLTGWQLAFKSRLAPYRRMNDGFKYVKEVR